MPATPPRASFPPAPGNDPLLAKLREFALVGAGLAANNRLDAFLRISDLVDAGVIQVRQGPLVNIAGGSSSAGPSGRPIVVEPAIDRTPPPPPGGFQAVSGVTQILFQTAFPVYRQGHGHSRTKIYAAPASPLPTFADAVLYTDFPGNIGVAPFDPASDMRLWATWTSHDGVESEPTGGTNGISATTGLLEDVHIANLNVNKLLAGSLAVSQYIQSADYVANTAGFRLQTTSGGAAFLEINGGAYIGGLVVGPTYIRSANYVLNTQGYGFNSDGTGQIGGLQITTNAVRSSNFVAGVSGFEWTYAGALTATGMNLYGGTLNAGTINGSEVISGSLRNSTNSVNFNLNATGTSLMLRAGTLTYYGSLAGWHYPVEINADGSGFFGRGIVAGGTVKASGSAYAIPSAERPAIVFEAAPTYDYGGAGP